MAKQGETPTTTTTTAAIPFLFSLPFEDTFTNVKDEISSLLSCHISFQLSLVAGLGSGTGLAWLLLLLLYKNDILKLLKIYLSRIIV